MGNAKASWIGIPVAALLILALPGPSRADTPVDAETPPLSARLVIPSGKVFDLKWPLRAKWIWQRELDPVTKLPGVERPVLRTEIEVPNSYQVVEVKSSTAKLHAIKGNHIELDLDGQLSEVFFRINDPKKELPADSALVLETGGQPARLIHPNCAPLSISMTPTGRQDVKILYVAASCEKITATGFDLLMLYSRDAVISRTNVQKRTAGALGLETYSVARPLKPSETALRLGQFALRGRSKAPGTPENFYAFQFEPTAVPPPRLTLTASLGVSYLRFTESALSVSATEFALTPKAAVAYWIKPGRFDISANAYMNAVTFGSTVTGATGPLLNDNPRWYGVSGRAGVQAHLGGDVAMKFSLGWYFWGMMVPQADYGVSLISGPQIFISLSGKTRIGHFYGGYVKFAPISDSPSNANLSSRELAGGLSYEISRPGIRHPLSLALDVAQATIIPTSVNDQLSLLSTSLSFNYSL